MKRMVFSMLVWILCSVAAVAGETNFLVAALRSARENNPDFQAVRQALKNAEMGISVADARRYPQVETKLWGSFVSVVPEMEQPEMVIDTPAGEMRIPGRTTRLGDYDRYGIDLEISQVFYAGGRLTGGVTQARRRTDVTAAQLEIFLRRLDHDVGIACLDVLKSTLLEKVGVRTLSLARAHAAEFRNREAAGAVMANAVLKAELRVSEAEAALLDIRHAIDVQTLRLKTITGADIAVTDDLESAIDLTRPPPDRETSVRDALERRGEIRLMDRRIDAVEHQLKMVIREKRPVVSGFARASYGKPGPDFVDNSWIDSYSAGINCAFTLWDFHRVDSRAAEIRGERERLAKQRAALVSAVDLDVTRSILGIESAVRRLEVAGRAKRQAEENFRIAADGFHQGILTNTDYLDAEIALDKARTGLVIQRNQCRRAWIDYYFAMGYDLLTEVFK